MESGLFQSSCQIRATGGIQLVSCNIQQFSFPILTPPHTLPLLFGHIMKSGSIPLSFLLHFLPQKRVMKRKRKKRKAVVNKWTSACVSCVTTCYLLSVNSLATHSPHLWVIKKYIFFFIYQSLNHPQLCHDKKLNSNHDNFLFQTLWVTTCSLVLGVIMV